MSREVIWRCDRCMVTYKPSLRLPEGVRFGVYSMEQEDCIDLCPSCQSDLEAWLRFPLEDDAKRGAIDPTTGQPA